MSPGPSVSPSTRPAAGPGPSPATSCPVLRAAGTGPALTSVVAGRTSAPDATTVVLVNATGGAEAYAEAMGVAPFAAAHGAPVLLTGTTSVPDVVARDIVDRKVTTAWIVGSTASVGPAVEQRLRSLGVTTVRRVTGGDRWSTAAELALGAATGPRSGAASHEAFLVPGDPGQQLDVASAAATAAATGRPLLLTGRAGVPAVTLNALRSLKVTSVTVVGSPAVVPEQTLTALRGAGVTTWKRVVGPTRWATATAVAAAAGPGLPVDRVVLTSGLVAGPELLLASAQGRPLLLTTATGLPGPTAAWLAGHRTATVTVVAPPGLVQTAVLVAAQTTRRPVR